MNDYKYFKQTLFLCLILNSSLMLSQNQYSAQLNQPDPLSTPSICMVSVNADNFNEIIWDKPTSNFIEYFKVYRESNEQTNQWDPIGITPYTSSSIFIDSTSHPEIQSYRYKISTVDKCGNETALSNLHKTMNLSILRGLNNSYSLIWDEYEGLEVNSYKIYRGIEMNDLLLIGSVSSGNFNYNDNFSPEGSIYYCIEVLCPSECNTNNLKSSSIYNTSRSNIVSNIERSIIKPDIKVSPNPFNSKTTISFSNSEHQLYILTVYDINGKSVYSESTSEENVEFERENLTDGFYFIEIQGDNTSLKTRMSILK